MSEQSTAKQASRIRASLRNLRSEFPWSNLSRIAIIEDEYLIADDVKHVLDLAGCPATEMVADVPDALEMLRQRSPDPAILDLSLKGEMSSPAADILVERRIPFVFMTGHERFAIPARFHWIVRCQTPIDPIDVVTTLLRVARRERT